MAAIIRRTALPLLPLVLSAAGSLHVQAQVSSTIAPAAPNATGAANQPALPVAAQVSTKSRKAALRFYERGGRALQQSQFATAEHDFAEALRLDPSQPEYYQALVVAQESQVTGLLHAAAREREQHPLAAERLLAEARGIDPANPRILQRDASAQSSSVSQRSALSPRGFVPAGVIALQSNRSTHSFHKTSDTRSLAREIAEAYGLRIAFDPDYIPKQVRMELDDADYGTAVSVFNMLAGTFVLPLDEHTMLVSQDTTANRTRLEHLFEQVVALPGYSTEQINETATLIRTLFELKQVSVAAQAGAIAIRAPEDTLRAIDTVLADLLNSGNEVMVDVKLYSVDTTKVRNLGVVLPTSFTAFSARSEIQNVLNTNSALIQQLIANGVIPSTATPAQIAAYLVFVAGLGGQSILQNTFFVFGGGLSTLATGQTSFGVTPVGLATGSYPSLNFVLNKSEATALDDLQLRVADRATGVFKAGTRYPIQTSIFSDIASSATTGNSGLQALLSRYLGTTSTLNTSAIIPQFQYEDLGLTVNATPKVTSPHEVSMKLEVKFSALAGSALNGIPVLASRQFSSTIALEDGQTAVLASLVQDSEAAAVTGIPGLTNLPGLSNLTNRSTNASHTNLVLLVTPHIVRHSHDVAKGPYVPLPSRPDDD